MNDYKLDTLALHAGQAKDEHVPSRAVPIHRTTAYNFRDTEHAANLFGLRELGYIYTRIMNPTQAVLEERMTAMEGGAGALALASGTSAVYYAIINICEAGDEIVSASHLYGGTYTMFNNIFPQFGITVRFVNPLDLGEIEAAINDKTRAVFIETIGNPGLSVPDFESIAELAHRHRLPVIADATFTTPALLRPMDHGVDITVYSLTKWLGGHGTGIGGVVVDSGRFDWTDPKFGLMNRPEGSYHGIRFAHDLGELQPLAYILRMRLVPLRNLGAAISPDNAWMFLQGIETLPLRMERHCDNALAVAQHLKQHPKVDWVSYAGLPGDRYHELAQRYTGGRPSSLLTFGLKGGFEAGVKFYDALGLIKRLVNIGDAKTLACHPASTTHRQLSEAEQVAVGVRPEMIRICVGIEHIDDIVADIDQALEAAG